MLAARRLLRISQRRYFSQSFIRQEVRDISGLQDRIHPSFQETRNNDLLCLQWPSPPRNVLLIKKRGDIAVDESLIEFAKHIKGSYPDTEIVLEASTAAKYHEEFPFPVYTETPNGNSATARYQDKIDFVSTLGGDGTILRAASLFASSQSVPPVLSFGMGTLGFLGEWKFGEYKRAFREVFMSGAIDAYGTRNGEAAEHEAPVTGTGWSSVRGKSMGSHRGSRVLLRNRLKVGVFDASGGRIATEPTSAALHASADTDIYAMNEVALHRGISPHLAIISIYVGGRLLTEAVADGLIVSTPTGSTAYSLSSGGAIVHPLVPSILLTPICPRSLSFRPLVLPANTPISLRFGEKNRGRELEVSVDGVRMQHGIEIGSEIKVIGEGILIEGGWEKREWRGGVPCIVRGAVGMERDSDDHWVGGLNALLKYNHPFGGIK
ncbi:ATP-NAD kinase [Pseudovirgaria hyperparasitica]|uniref:ATP-NAD kinase n=1 Tax=Pseudovirgaria hyperparasitica TaxID=470096 RepID=A0A6A6W004_9PEZI|nr:ATP-NAD kinase [Pseudovirgaria hyperparasitica]KAF2755835.1 ATP-NAD kinase [Pseudovirgaria hyperparasitica]